MKFKGRRGVTIILLMIALNMRLLWIDYKEGNNPSIALMVILGLTDLIILDMTVFRNYSIIEEKRLVVRLGAVSQILQYNDISSIKRSYNPLAGMSLSFIRLAIRHKKGVAYISVKDEAEFISELKKKNPEIKYTKSQKNKNNKCHRI